MSGQKKHSAAMYGISRIDDYIHRTHAWRVSLCRSGKRHVKNFPDKKLSGKRKALQAAKLYRDELLLKHPPISRKQNCAIVRANNKSGIPGVYTYSKSYELRDGTLKSTRYWEANWPDDQGGSHSISFSIKQYGEERAKQLAIRARKKGLRGIKGVFWACERGDVNAEQFVQRAAGATSRAAGTR